MLKLSLAAVVLAFVFVSCAPGASGPGSRFNPIRVEALNPVSIAQSAEINIVTAGPVRAATRTQADEALVGLSNVNPIKGQKISVEVFWLRVVEVAAPKGIDVGLVKQTAMREITDVGTTTYSILDSLDLVFAVKVEPSVPVGSYPVVVRLVNLQNSALTGTVIFSVNVTVPAPAK